MGLLSKTSKESRSLGAFETLDADEARDLQELSRQDEQVNRCDPHVIADASFLLLIAFICAYGPIYLMYNKPMYEASLLIRVEFLGLDDIGTDTICFKQTFYCVILLALAIATYIDGTYNGQMKTLTVTEVSGQSEMDVVGGGRLLSPRYVEVRTTITRQYTDWSPQINFQKRYAGCTFLTGVFLLIYGLVGWLVFAESCRIPNRIVRAVNNLCLDPAVAYAAMDCDNFAIEDIKVHKKYDLGRTTTLPPGPLIVQFEDLIPAFKAILGMYDKAVHETLTVRPEADLLEELRETGGVGCRAIRPLCVAPYGWNLTTACTCFGDANTQYPTLSNYGVYCNEWDGKDSPVWCYTHAMVACGNTVVPSVPYEGTNTIRPSTGPCTGEVELSSALLAELEFSTIMSLRFIFGSCILAGVLCVLMSGKVANDARKMGHAHDRAFASEADATTESGKRLQAEASQMIKEPSHTKHCVIL